MNSPKKVENMFLVSFYHFIFHHYSHIINLIFSVKIMLFYWKGNILHILRNILYLVVSVLLLVEFCTGEILERQFGTHSVHSIFPITFHIEDLQKTKEQVQIIIPADDCWQVGAHSAHRFFPLTFHIVDLPKRKEDWESGKPFKKQEC